MTFAIPGGWHDCGMMNWYRLNLWYVFVTILSFSMEIVRSGKLTDVDSSLDSHSRIPKLCVVALDISKSCEV